MMKCQYHTVPHDQSGSMRKGSAGVLSFGCVEEDREYWIGSPTQQLELKREAPLRNVTIQDNASKHKQPIPKTHPHTIWVEVAPSSYPCKQN